jgi:ectoine hydroxylase-related dioxygenase (phytanoyl-CoA dioxygenase family)
MLRLPLRRIASKKPASRPFVTINASGEADNLRARMAKHGHLFLPHLVPRDVVLEARAEALSLCREAGWIDAQAGPLAARWSGCEPVNDGNPEWPTFYKRWIAASAFNSLPEHPAIMEVAASLLGDSVLVHPRKIGRVTFPQNEGQQTPVHQDFFHVHGTAETYTAWVPLGDCPQELGSLMVADESHKAGFREHGPSTGTGGWSVEAGADVLWRSQDFAAGDVLFFHSLTMHQALPNRTRRELRLSVDNRYQRVGDAIDPAALRPHI